ncbi:Citrate synthase (si) [hydrothermal vent metagenome]|uniref:Citrate synthase (Si) n=1 Tax=hydrothermal vent metagenome TaxID=652676 RepID=A0A3B1D8V7_9ZZZZ
MSDAPLISSLMLQGVQRLVERVTMESKPWFPGLDGVIADETAISAIDREIQYRGYPLSELASQASFVEVAYLLLHGELPSGDFLADYQSILFESSDVPASVLQMLDDLPMHVDMTDALRSAVSLLGHHDQQMADVNRNAIVQKSTRLLAQLPVIIAARHRQQMGCQPVQPDHRYSYIANLLQMITGVLPNEKQERALEALFILYAEHGFNPSTYTARLVASTGADYHSAVTAAIGSIKGPLHGGMRSRVIEILDEVQHVDRAEKWVERASLQRRPVPGFGHHMHLQGDPRARLLRCHCRQLAELTGQKELEERADAIRHAVAEHYGLLAHLNWPAARLLHYLDIPPDLFAPLFIISRLTGWSAHVIEQQEIRRPIRPCSRYNGPQPRPFIPLGER